MKFTTSILSVLLSSIIAVEAFSIGLPGQKVLLGDGESVPGDNPLTYCKKDHSDDLLVLEKVNLNPNPPAKYCSHYTTNGTR